MKKVLVLLGLLVVMVGCGGGVPEERLEVEVEGAAVVDEVVVDEEEDEAAPEAIAPTQPRLTVLADGQIQLGRPALPLSFETSGTLLRLDVGVGDVVEAGEVLGVLADGTLQENVASTALRVAQAENNLVKVEVELENLETWEPDEGAVAIAEANIASAEENLSSARAQDAAAGSGLTQVNVSIQQAERELASAQENYDNAFSPGREWEVGYQERICSPGVPPPCTGPTYAERIEQDRDFAKVRLQNAEDQLRIARSNYAVEAARVSGDASVGAEASLVAAQQELERALKGPTDEQLATAVFNVEQAKLTLEQEEFALMQAENALSQAQLVAPWGGVVQSVAVSEGTRVGPGTAVLTLLDTAQFEFHTTNLSERDLSQIRVGQGVQVTLKAYPNEPFEGEVVRIGLQATGTLGDAALFPVVVRLDSLEGGDDGRVVRAGMTGQAEILREE